MLIKKIKVKLSAGLIFFLAVVVVTSSCSTNKDKLVTFYTKLVKTSMVKEVSSVQYKQFPGIITETEEVNLAFRVAGPIQKIYIKEGDYVKKGQLIAEMDTRDYMVQKNAIEARVKQLQSEYERIAELNRKKSVADNDFEKMKAGKEMAEAQLKNANDQLQDTKLYAPFAGYISKVMFENGELVNHGTPIASLIDVSMLKVEINVPASLYINRDQITKIECTQEDLKGASFLLTVYADNIKANNNGLYTLYLYHKPSANSKLAPGMNVSVNISYQNENEALLNIPAVAVFEKDNNSCVWLVKDSKVKSQIIVTNNLVREGEVGVVEGLKAGQEVVVGGLHLLKENEEVRVVAPDSETNIGNIL